MMLSSSSLFHYTRSHRALLSILEETFRPNFCLEETPFDEDGSALQNGTPMVCFCDIPLSAAASHMGQYGRYALGLTKEWGTSHGVSPVLYTHGRSPVSTGLKRLMTNGLRIGKGPIDSAIWDEVTRILSFTKPYETSKQKDGKAVVTRYYDEREWRWVPQDLPPEIKYGIDSSQFVEGKPETEPTQLLHLSCRLSFEPADIRFIVVSADEEILPTVREIHRIKERYSNDEKTLLTTRVISATQIASDF
jgi:Putative abortive phage resistance protein AbiGi, antitoxin